MKKLFAVFVTLLGLGLAVPGAPAVDAAVEARALSEAQTAALEWLALVDGGKSAAAWDNAAADLKKHVSKKKWQSALREMRDPVGKSVSRKVQSATYTKELPGAPEGEYVIVRFDSAFAKRAAATETVTAFLGNDLRWRVSAYSVK